MILLITSIFLGIIFGIIVGIVPGLHPNTIAAIIIFTEYNTEFSVLLFSCLITSNIFEFLSAAYLGAPEEGESLAKLPLHKLILDKRGLVGMKIVAFTSIITYSIFLIIGLFMTTQIANIYYIVKDYAWIILAGICFHLIIKEKSIRKGILFFGLSGMLGLLTFNLELSDPFLPLLTGLFGISGLIDLTNKENKIPNQMSKVVVESNFIEIFFASIIGIIGSIIMAIVPSMSPSQIGLITQEFKKRKTSDELKIASMTSINISDNILSIIALIAINKGRSGVVTKIGELIIINNENFYLLLFTGFFACVISSYLLIKISNKISKKAEWFNNKKLKIGVILFVAILSFLFNGLWGIIILILSTLLGYYCMKHDVRRSQLLGSLVIPTILFYISIL